MISPFVSTMVFATAPSPIPARLKTGPSHYRRPTTALCVHLATPKYFTPIELLTQYTEITCFHAPCSDDQLRVILFSPLPPGIHHSHLHLFSYALVHQILTSSLIKFRGISPNGLQLLSSKDVIHVTVLLHTHSYNHSLTNGIYPSLWKTSHIIPLKNLRSCSPTDTRPIANLSYLIKPFDALITSQINYVLDTHAIFNSLQSGLKQFHNTQTTLLDILDNVR